MTLYGTRKQIVHCQHISIVTTYHLKCPDSANPDFQCARYTLDILKLDTYHQHRLAGLRQNSSSFCAIPTALLLEADSPRMSVRRRASAIEQTTALLGSAARWPQMSARSKPLLKALATHETLACGDNNIPSGQHFYEMLLGSTRLFTLPKSREYTILLE